jgi:hypothetical protein
MGDRDATPQSTPLVAQWARRAALQARLAHAQLRSEVLTLQARHAIDDCAATRRSVKRSRDQWRTWSLRLDTLLQSTDGAWKRCVLRSCATCGRVCFPASAEWIEPPRWVRDRLLEGWPGLTVAPARCPQCRPSIDGARDGRGSFGDTEPQGTATPSPAAMLLRIAANLEAGVAALLARWPGLTEAEALERVLEAAASELASELTPDELSTRVGELREVARLLRAERARAERTRSARPGRGADRFRPPLPSR